jgi:tetratricopeptide (TPR) repeat protein
VSSLRPPSPLRKSGAGAGDGKGVGAAVNDPATRRKRADQFMQTGRFPEALSLLDDLVSELAKDATIHGLRARALFEVHRAAPDGLPRTVLEAVRRAHEIDPDEPHAYFTKGLVYKQGGELSKAIVCWRRVLQAEPKHIDAQREIRLAKLRGG